mmetsp:Transcript_67055/g.135177  ORF Transcript_67055/g.135177 Transcript_67055/m.135177 type:complete len:98 (+) Transcript_67055:136-429(+)
MDPSGSTGSSYRRKRLRVRRPPPPKTALAAALMLVGGIILILLGSIIAVLEDKNRGCAMLLMGLLVFIPGSYSSTLLWGAYRGWPGYRYTQVPSYDD